MSNILLPKPALGTPIAKGQLLSKGLVANFPFSDGRGDVLSDFSLEKNHGTITGATWVGNGLNFVAANSDKVEASAPPISTTVYTIIVDFKTGGSGTSRPVNLGNTAEAQHFTALDANIGTDFTFWFAYNFGENIVYTAEVPTANTRYVLAGVTVGPTERHLYINGRLVDSSSTFSTPNAFNILAIGALVRSTITYSDCDVYDAKIYNRALSASEIAALYINPALPMQQPPIWLFTPPVVSSGIVPIIQAHARRRAG